MDSKTKLTKEEKSYIAGFLDGDGSIFAQIVKGGNYKYGYTIRVSIGFYQKKNKYWFILKLKKLLKYGYVRIRKNSSMAEYVITAIGAVEQILLLIKDFLILKKKVANLVLNIIEKKRNINSKKKFIELCQLVDNIADLNYSKNKKITTVIVLKYLNNIN